MFSIFDTATVMCSALLHDATSSLPHRSKLIRCIGLARDMLRRLSSATTVALKTCALLSNINLRVPLSTGERNLIIPRESKKKAELADSFTDHPQQADAWRGVAGTASWLLIRLPTRTNKQVVPLRSAKQSTNGFCLNCLQMTSAGLI